MPSVLPVQKPELAEAQTPRHRPWRPKKSKKKPIFSAMDLVCSRSEILAAGRYDSQFRAALNKLLALESRRRVDDWKPEGNSSQQVFVSLARHLLALFPVPDFLWNGFFGRPRHVAIFVPLVQAVAEGKSIYQYMKSGQFPVSLQRAQCHQFLQSPSDMSFLEGLRRTQAGRVAPALLSELLQTEWGRDLFEPSIEARWTTWVQWLERQPDLDVVQLGPLSDFVINRLEDADFSLKGRTAASLRATMESWHQKLAQSHTEHRDFVTEFPRSGFDGAEFVNFIDPETTDRWQVREILTLPALREEGRHQHHCVFDYEKHIWSSRSSIWSLTRNETRKLTIEVRNADREIVQVRGPCNRLPTNEELSVINRWADLARLKLSYRIVHR
jgi:hypothetical protein